MVVSGLPIRNEREHGSEIALMALHITDAIQTFKIHHRADRALQLRIGINSGKTFLSAIVRIQYKSVHILHPYTHLHF